MPLSWNEIRTRAIAFSHDWKNATDENADAKTFWDELFEVFGVKRRRVATFEHRVKHDGKRGFIDLLWKKVVLIEHKSRGKNLSRAHTQAKDYFPGLKDADLPRYIIVCDFANFKIYDLETDELTEFALKELPNQILSLGFIAGVEKRTYKEQDPVNEEAAEALGQLHDELKKVGYEGHDLEVYLVRLLFCLFADDTGIFVPINIFNDYIETRTDEDGSDLGPRLQELFETLNRPVEKRYKTLDESLQQFPYVNGDLFSEALPIAPFTSKLRKALLNCCDVNWGEISPAIFGSLFQSIMNAKQRRDLGAHYTSEKNILKAIGPLFLDDLKAEYEKVKTQKGKLAAFHQKLATLNFLDPACGCGNFLVIAYRELRELELEVIEKLHGKRDLQLTIDALKDYVKVDVNQFHGIEIDEWPAQIARVAMWLIDHQMNVKVSALFGNVMVRIPLVKSANIHQQDALTYDWNKVVAGRKCNFLLGNPPFKGARLMTAAQKKSNLAALTGVHGANNLDLVAGWYAKAARFLNPTAKAALVSTNSITQGEQVGLLWAWMLSQGVHIHFAHRTFKWKNEAGGEAAVHCVIIGFALFDNPTKQLFDYATVTSDPTKKSAVNINPYLVDADNILLSKRSTPLQPVISKMEFGSMANDNGALLIETAADRREMIARDPQAKQFIKKFFQVDEFLSDHERWCLWLKDFPTKEFRTITPIRERLALCKKHREDSDRPATQKLGETPWLFGEIRQPDTNYLLVPRHSSETRRYVPMGFMTPDLICGDANLMVPGATMYEFGVMSSLMHNAWISGVCGRIKSDFRYSATIVYNNYPWPSDITGPRKAVIEKAASNVLLVREKHKGSSLSTLYDPLAMPTDLRKAHKLLDSEVDLAYSKRVFTSDAERVAYLLVRYRDAAAALKGTGKPKPKKSAKKGPTKETP